MKDIKNSIDDIEVNLRDLPELTDRLADVREETLRYSQLATAQENLKHLFTVPETVVKTETEIEKAIFWMLIKPSLNWNRQEMIWYVKFFFTKKK